MNLFAGLAEYFVEQFVRRSAVGKSLVVAVEIFHAFDAAVFRRPVLLRNIDLERVRAVIASGSNGSIRQPFETPLGAAPQKRNAGDLGHCGFASAVPLGSSWSGDDLR